MKTTVEADPGQSWQVIPLAEVEVAGVGAVYEVAGMHIEPIAVYVGNGVFKGLHLEQRGEVNSVRLGIEEHHDLQAGRTAMPLKRFGQAPPELLEDQSGLLKYLIDEVCVFYACAAEQGLPDVYTIDQEGVATKLRVFADLQSKLFHGKLSTSKDGYIDLNK